MQSLDINVSLPRERRQGSVPNSSAMKDFEPIFRENIGSPDFCPNDSCNYNAITTPLGKEMLYSNAQSGGKHFGGSVRDGSLRDRLVFGRNDYQVENTAETEHQVGIGPHAHAAPHIVSGQPGMNRNSGRPPQLPRGGINRYARRRASREDHQCLSQDDMSRHLERMTSCQQTKVQNNIGEQAISANALDRHRHESIKRREEVLQREPVRLESYVEIPDEKSSNRPMTKGWRKECADTSANTSGARLNFNSYGRSQGACDETRFDTLHPVSRKTDESPQTHHIRRQVEDSQPLQRSSSRETISSPNRLSICGGSPHADQKGLRMASPSHLAHGGAHGASVARDKRGTSIFEPKIRISGNGTVNTLLYRLHNILLEANPCETLEVARTYNEKMGKIESLSQALRDASELIIFASKSATVDALTDAFCDSRDLWKCRLIRTLRETLVQQIRFGSKLLKQLHELKIKIETSVDPRSGPGGNPTQRCQTGTSNPTKGIIETELPTERDYLAMGGKRNMPGPFCAYGLSSINHNATEYDSKRERDYHQKAECYQEVRDGLIELLRYAHTYNCNVPATELQIPRNIIRSLKNTLSEVSFTPCITTLGSSKRESPVNDGIRHDGDRSDEIGGAFSRNLRRILNFEMVYLDTLLKMCQHRASVTELQQKLAKRMKILLSSR